MSENASRAKRESQWDSAYERRGESHVSWYQPSPDESIELLEALAVGPGAAIIDVGGGASTLVDRLVGRGYDDVTVLDISRAALELARRRLADPDAVEWLHEDVLLWQPRRTYELWHDRAVFHFLVAAEERAAYLARLEAALAPSGALIIGVFAPDGPSRCSGLPVARYSTEELQMALGPTFELVRSFRKEHVTPAGAHQPFTWIAARRHGREQ